jgi:hypothetical protein
MNFTIILSIILVFWLQIEAVAYETKMANEVKECQATMSYIWSEADALTKKYNKLKRKKR